MKPVIVKEEEQVTQSSLPQVISYINDLEFWANLEMLFKVLQPIGHAQANSGRDRAGLGEVIPHWLSIQASWDALEEVGQDPLINYQELEALRKQRFDVQTDDIHYMAFALDPATTDPKHHLLTTDIVRRAHNFLEDNTNAEEYGNIFREFCQFRAREGNLFGPGSRIYRAASEGTPHHQHVLDSWRSKSGSFDEETNTEPLHGGMDLLYPHSRFWCDRYLIPDEYQCTPDCMCVYHSTDAVP
ncbi:hypothetical protein AUP68_11331 [Ilyonectria robusta]